MQKFNYHSHCNYCDGIESMENMIKGAIEKGLTHYGITSHGPLPFTAEWTMNPQKVNNYLEEFKSLKSKYKDQIQLFIGLELDYFTDINPWETAKIKREDLDFFVGSVHFLGINHKGERWTVDNTLEEMETGIRDNFNGDTKEAIKRYYQLIGEMAQNLKPDIIAHIDLIQKLNQNHYFFTGEEDWYQQGVIDCLEVIRNTDSIVELNSGGRYRGYTESFYPSPWILREMLHRNIKITVNTDAHDIPGIDYGFEEMMAWLKSEGCQEIYMLTQQGWKPIKI